MKPEEKVLELIDKFTLEGNYLQGLDKRKAQALICVDEILKEGACQYGATAVEYGREDFWYEVKSIIQEL